jgi:hypothetical protein
MQAFDYEALAYDGAVYCCGCFPEDVDPNGPEVRPVFASDEWDYYPACDHCGREHDYVSLTSATVDNTEVATWFERDRAQVTLTDKRTGAELLDLWDEDVAQAVEDGFLDPRDWHGSAYEYAKHLRRV